MVGYMQTTNEFKTHHTVVHQYKTLICQTINTQELQLSDCMHVCIEVHFVPSL